MSKDGMARLVVALMVSGGVTSIDLVNPRAAHAAVLKAANTRGQSIAQSFDAGSISASPDPQVGLRVAGMTQALWRAVALGLLRPRNGSSVLVVTAKAEAESNRELGALREWEQEVVAAAGHYWATTLSTAVKHRPSSRGSLAGI